MCVVRVLGVGVSGGADERRDGEGRGLGVEQIEGDSGDGGPADRVSDEGGLALVFRTDSGLGVLDVRCITNPCDDFTRWGGTSASLKGLA